MSLKDKFESFKCGTGFTDYHQLPENGDQTPPNNTPSKPALSLRVKLGALGLCLAVALAAVTFFAWPLLRVGKLPETYTCGQSREEALSRGCRIEPMVYGWMPKQCYFDELSREYTPFEDRQWYRDSNMTEPLTSEEMWEGVVTHVFTSRYHGQHCLFLWRKLSLAVDERRSHLDLKSLEVDHAKHCSKILEHGVRETNETVNDVVLGYYTCVPLPWA
jgi:hypothetical protein